MVTLQKPGGRRGEGFTLVEILFVIGIIGLLLAIAMPSWFRARQTAQAKSCQHNLKQLSGAKERWAMDNQKGADDTPAMSDLVVPGLYLKNTPACPNGGTYTIGRLSETPTCSIAGSAGDPNAHYIP